MDTIFQWICHRNPERCLPGALFLCARCLGMYFGALVGALGVLAIWAGGLRPAGKAPVWILVAGIAATPVEVALEWTALFAGTNPLRFALGVLLGTSLVGAMGLSLSPARVRNGRPLHAAWLCAVGLLDFGLIAGILFMQRGGGLRTGLLMPIALLGAAALVGITLLVLGRWGWAGLRSETGGQDP